MYAVHGLFESFGEFFKYITNNDYSRTGSGNPMGSDLTIDISNMAYSPLNIQAHIMICVN